jgi:hypothetical protein
MPSTTSVAAASSLIGEVPFRRLAGQVTCRRKIGAGAFGGPSKRILATIRPLTPPQLPNQLGPATMIASRPPRGHSPWRTIRTRPPG